MVEISNEMYREFIRAEQTIELLREAVKRLPAYKADDVIRYLLGIDQEGDGNA